MASVTDLLKQAQKFSIDNSPFLLTMAGTAGVVATGVLAAKGGIKAAQVLREEALMKASSPEGTHLTTLDGILTPKEKAQLTWKLYLPAVAVGTLTCGSIVFANQIGTRRAAAMAAAMTISEKAFTEYREKVVETIGAAKETKVRDGVAQDKFDANLEKASTVVIGGDKQLCFDAYSARYFESTMEDLKHAMNLVNNRINNQNYASLSDFYDALGLDHTQTSDDVGWNVDKLLDIEFTAVIGPKNLPAIAMTYRTEPIRDFFRLR